MEFSDILPFKKRRFLNVFCQKTALFLKINGHILRELK